MGGRIWPDDMTPSELKRLMDWLAGSSICEIEVIEGDARIHLVKGRSGDRTISTEATPALPAPAECVVAAPLPGLFYLRASPEATPFIAVGQRIASGETVGLIEAMKMFNPVTSDIGGVIDAILVEAGQEVEVGQPLLRLRRDEGASR